MSYVMTNYNKSTKVWFEFATRKDKNPLKKELNYGWRRKKHYKRYSNQCIRRYKGLLQNGDFKKVFDLWWTIH